MDYIPIPGDCPRCNSFDDDLGWRDGICESCYIEELTEGE